VNKTPLFGRFFRLLPPMVLFCLAACNAQPSLEGSYRSGPESPKVTMELTQRGGGTWKTDTDAETFEWQAGGGTIVIHTKTGGVIRGSIRDKAIALDLPDLGEIVLNRAGK
jgi:hypothetical protein